MKNKIIYKVIFVIAVIVFLVTGVILLKLYIPEKNDSSEYKNSTSKTVTQNITEVSTTLPDNPINFKKLQKKSKDVYAWINVPGTNIDYAIVQSSKDKSDSFYLDHNINGDYEFQGMIFSQKKNSKDFTDPVTVLYGHNMKNGSMFASLHKFEDKSFFDEHSEIYIYTPGRILTYKIVSAYVYDNRHILNTFNFSRKKDFKKYIKSLTEPRSFICNVRDDISVTTDNRILTLSTCTSSDAQRYLVQGVLSDEQRTN